MSQHGEAAEQVVSMATNAAVKTVECAAEIVGKGSLSLATFLLAVLKDQKKTRGRTRIQSFNGRPTKVFAIMARDMKTFSKEATTFDRPAFQKMLKDIERGNIDCVITKDLSRLGRNYAKTGYYTEEYFLEHGVRYIAVNDNVDTMKDDNDIAPFKNILNQILYESKIILKKRHQAIWD